MDVWGKFTFHCDCEPLPAPGNIVFLSENDSGYRCNTWSRIAVPKPGTISTCFQAPVGGCGADTLLWVCLCLTRAEY